MIQENNLNNKLSHSNLHPFPNTRPRNSKDSDIPTFDLSDMRARLPEAVADLMTLSAPDKDEEPEFYELQIATAERLLRKLVDDSQRQCLLHISPQGGKTGVAGAYFRLLKMLVPDLQGVLICGNDQIDLRSQNKIALEHLGLSVLSRKERFALPSTPRPFVVFFDETHYGDGHDMTIAQFLAKHDLMLAENVVFIGISATPFSALQLPTVQVPLPDLEQQGYNSVPLMLAKGRIRQATQLFLKRDQQIIIQTHSSIYQHLAREAQAPMPGGYGIIRCRSTEAMALERHVAQTFGSLVHVVHYNMHSRDITDLESYLKKKRTGVFTLILIQQKARMGVVVPTKYVRFMYEYSHSSSIETTAQSILGRSLGFGKQQHGCVVYTHLKNATAYGLFSSGRLNDFFQYRKKHRLIISARAQEVTLHASPSYRSLARLVFHGRTKPDTIKEAVYNILKTEFSNLSRIRYNTLSEREKLPPFVTRMGLEEMLTSTYLLGFGAEPGSVGVLIIDRFHPSVRHKRWWKGIHVHVVLRMHNEGKDELSIRPTPSSLFYRES